VIDKTLLKNKFDEYNSDKGWSHSYQDAYSEILPDRLNNLLEVGIGNYNNNESSIYVWRDIYQNAKIYAIDNDPSKLINEKNIHSFLVDQFHSDQLQNFVDEISIKFDVIIDDGVHLFDQSINTFEHLIHLLDDNGIYCIEDVKKDLPRYVDGHQLLEQFIEYFSVNNNYAYDIFDTNLGVNDDSIVICIRKVINDDNTNK
jgi:hypothetical protein